MTTYREFCIQCINRIDEVIQRGDMNGSNMYVIGKNLTYIQMVLRNEKLIDSEMTKGKAFEDNENEIDYIMELCKRAV